MPHPLSIYFSCSVRTERAATESISVACSDVKEHKAKPRRRMEELGGIVTPDVHSGGEHWSFLLTAGWLGINQCCQVSFVQPNPVDS